VYKNLFMNISVRYKKMSIYIHIILYRFERMIENKHHSPFISIYFFVIYSRSF